MAKDRYCFLVLEESLPEGTIAEHRKSRPKAKRRAPANPQRPATDRPVLQTSPRSRQVA